MNVKLNEAVAEKVMGWTRPPNKLPEGRWLIPWGCYLIAGVQEVPKGDYTADKYWQAPDGTYHEQPPDYSGDWAAFGELWEHLMLLKQKVHVQSSWPGECAVTIGDYTFSSELPEAVCRAALKAKEVER